jgi:hypothetical protein
MWQTSGTRHSTKRAVASNNDNHTWNIKCTTSRITEEPPSTPSLFSTIGGTTDVWEGRSADQTGVSLTFDCQMATADQQRLRLRIPAIATIPWYTSITASALSSILITPGENRVLTLDSVGNRAMHIAHSPGVPLFLSHERASHNLLSTGRHPINTNGDKTQFRQLGKLTRKRLLLHCL